MSKPVLQVIIASTRPGRVGPSVAEWFREQAVSAELFDVELIDLAEVNLPFLDEPHHPRLGTYVHQHTKDWSATIARGDAYVFVTPEYNHSFNAVLKNAIDFLHSEWQHKPVGFVSYGGVAAGTRAVQALKQVVVGLKMLPVVEAVNIPFVTQHLDGDRFAPSEVTAAAATALLTELARWTDATRSLRTPRVAAAA